MSAEFFDTRLGLLSCTDYLKVLRECWLALSSRDPRVPEYSDELGRRLLLFLEGYHQGCKIQNLSTSISAVDFFNTHLVDVLMLKASGVIVSGTVYFDFGAGAGVPGLLFWTLFDGSWIFCDSEVSKSKHLETELDRLWASLSSSGVVRSRPRVFYGRGEEVLDQIPGEKTLISRAVASILKSVRWFEKCSTWNNMIFLKGPKYSEEIKEIESSNKDKTMRTEVLFRYRIDPLDPRERVILRLARIR